MIGEVISWENDFIVISTGKEVYRTEALPVNGDGVCLECSVEFDIDANYNRAVNVKRVYFAPNMVALRRDIHNVIVVDEGVNCPYEIACEGSMHYQGFGRINVALTKNKNTLDVILPIMKKIGANWCQRENEPIKLKIIDGNKTVEVYDYSFQGGLVATLTRVKDEEAFTKTWDEFFKLHSQLHNDFFKMCFEQIKIVDIQKKLYFGSSFKRRYNQFKYRSSKYDYIKI